MTHVCDAYKTKWDGNNFLKRGHTLLTQTSHQAIYKWETVVKEKKKRLVKKTKFLPRGDRSICCSLRVAVPSLRPGETEASGRGYGYT